MAAYTDYYDLAKSDLSTDLLYLDPKNPRLSLSLDNRMSRLSDDAICSEKTQKEILLTLREDKFHIPELIRSFATRGFAKGLQPIIVKKINAKKYLVLEGNRRVASIKTLLSSSTTEIDKAHLKTLDKIPVEIFKYVKNNQFSEQDVIAGVLGNIHITGAEPWGSMEQAMVIHGHYLAALDSYRYSNGLYSDENYVYIKAVMEKTARLHNMSLANVTSYIHIYALYDALKNEDYAVMPEHYSLLDLAIKGAETRDYFSFDTKDATITRGGMMLLNAVCIADKAIVKNPKDFSAFKYIINHGRESDIVSVLDHRKSVVSVKAKIQDRKQDRAFINMLEKIDKLVDSLKNSKYKGTREEKRIIRKIEKGFKKITRLAKN
jgi:hypothetical protein